MPAGTAVLVDASGEPRVRCGGGAPLSATGPSRFADQLPVGTPWPGYTAASVIAIRPGSVAATLTLVSLTSGTTYDQSMTSGSSVPASPAPTAPSTVTATVTAVAGAGRVDAAGDFGLSVPITRPASDTVYRPAGYSAVVVCAAVRAAGGSAYGKGLDNSTNADADVNC